MIHASHLKSLASGEGIRKATGTSLAALAGVSMTLALAAPAAQAVVVTGSLYVSDYGKLELDRYKYTYDSVLNRITSLTANGIGNNSNSAYFLGGGANPIKEGIHGTANDLIIVGGAQGGGTTTIQRYTLGGTLIGTIPVAFSAFCAANSCNANSLGIGNVLATNDGKYMYAPLESAGYVVKVDLANGAIVDSYKFAGAHDVAIAANGDVYAANYNNGSAKVVRLGSNLAYKQDLVAHSSGFRPSGLSIAADGSLYVQDNRQGGPDSVLHYNITGTNTLTATLNTATSYVGSAGNNALEFTFGNNIGPDGKLYIAGLGGGGKGSFSVKAGYQDGIYQFDTDPAHLSVKLAIAGFTEKNGSVPGFLGSSGLSAPKYLQFDTNFAAASDAGYTAAVPEPETYALMLAGLAAVGLKVRRRSDRRA